MALALGIGAAAWRCSRSPGGFYDREIYTMDSQAHKRYGLLSLAFAGYFATACAFRLETAGIAGLALYALVVVFYAASFLRGSADE